MKLFLFNVRDDKDPLYIISGEEILIALKKITLERKKQWGGQEKLMAREMQTDFFYLHFSSQEFFWDKISLTSLWHISWLIFIPHLLFFLYLHHQLNFLFLPASFHPRNSSLFRLLVVMCWNLICLQKIYFA